MAGGHSGSCSLIQLACSGSVDKGCPCPRAQLWPLCILPQSTSWRGRGPEGSGYRGRTGAAGSRDQDTPQHLPALLCLHQALARLGVHYCGSPHWVTTEATGRGQTSGISVWSSFFWVVPHLEVLRGPSWWGPGDPIGCQGSNLGSNPTCYTIFKPQ